MNRLIPYIIAIATILLPSCDKDIEKKNIALDDYESDYGELVEKYADMKFANCTEAISAGNEIASVLYSTADKAFKENDAKAKSDTTISESYCRHTTMWLTRCTQYAPKILTNGKKTTAKRLKRFYKRQAAPSMHTTTIPCGAKT